MGNKLQLSVGLNQRLSMNQQLQHAIKLLHYTTIDMKQHLQTCLATNPLLECDKTDFEDITEVEEAEQHDEPSFSSTRLTETGKTSTQYRFEDLSFIENISSQKTLRDHLKEQALSCQFSQTELAVAEFIIESIDDDGYLTIPITEIDAMLPISLTDDCEIANRVLTQIKTFDPIGVGALNIQESLSLQLTPFLAENPIALIAKSIIDHYFDLLSKGNHKAILKILKIDNKRFAEAISLIKSLNPHPGSQFHTEASHNIEPELYVKKIKETWQVFMVDSVLTHIKINKGYQKIIQLNRRDSHYESLKQELSEAKALLTALKRRNETLLAVGSYIVSMQQAFLEHGHAALKPMNIADVATALSLHESTVSRITTGKYIATPKGTFELKFFFPSHVSSQQGEAVSDVAIKSYIKKLIANESADHVLTDDEIATYLHEKGIKIARRTVAKYREACQILPSYQRQRMKEPAIG
jgi:RNA polymerase sigma-54 factor